MKYGSTKVTQMPPVHAANLVANSGNTAYGVDVIVISWIVTYRPGKGLVLISSRVELIKSHRIISSECDKGKQNNENYFFTKQNHSWNDRHCVFFSCDISKSYFYQKHWFQKWIKISMDFIVLLKISPNKMSISVSHSHLSHFLFCKISVPSLSESVAGSAKISVKSIKISPVLKILYQQYFIYHQCPSCTYESQYCTNVQ